MAATEFFQSSFYRYSVNAVAVTVMGVLLQVITELWVDVSFNVGEAIQVSGRKSFALSCLYIQLMLGDLLISV